jgi:hemerythrin superfamily protein
MPTSQQQTERTKIESQIKNDFSELQKKLETLKSEIQSETDQTKKQEKVPKILTKIFLKI